MKTGKPILAGVILLVLVFMQGQAGTREWKMVFCTGNSLVEMMREYDKSEVSNPSTKYADANFFAGYVVGVADATEGVFWQYSEGSGITIGQVPAIVSKYLKNHPERWNRTAESLIADALKEAFPLPKKK